MYYYKFFFIHICLNYLISICKWKTKPAALPSFKEHVLQCPDIFVWTWDAIQRMFGLGCWLNDRPSVFIPQASLVHILYNPDGWNVELILPMSQTGIGLWTCSVVARRADSKPMPPPLYLTNKKTILNGLTIFNRNIHTLLRYTNVVYPSKLSIVKRHCFIYGSIQGEAKDIL